MIHLSSIERPQDSINIKKMMSIPEAPKQFTLSDILSLNDLKEMKSTISQAQNIGFGGLSARAKVSLVYQGMGADFDWYGDLKYNTLDNNVGFLRKNIMEAEQKGVDKLQAARMFAYLRIVFGEALDNVDGSFRNYFNEIVRIAINENLSHTDLDHLVTHAQLVAWFKVMVTPGNSQWWYEIHEEDFQFLSQVRLPTIEQELALKAALKIINPHSFKVSPDLVSQATHLITTYKAKPNKHELLPPDWRTKWDYMTDIASDLAILLASNVLCTKQGLVLSFDQVSELPQEQHVTLPPRKNLF